MNVGNYDIDQPSNLSLYRTKKKVMSRYRRLVTYGCGLRDTASPWDGCSYIRQEPALEQNPDIKVLHGSFIVDYIYL